MHRFNAYVLKLWACGLPSLKLYLNSSLGSLMPLSLALSILKDKGLDYTVIPVCVLKPL